MPRMPASDIGGSDPPKSRVHRRSERVSGNAPSGLPTQSQTTLGRDGRYGNPGKSASRLAISSSPSSRKSSPGVGPAASAGGKKFKNDP